MSMVRTYTCRLYPTRAQAAELSTRLDAACELYNATLRELYRAWAAPERTSAEQAGAARPDDRRAQGIEQTCLQAAVVDDVVRRAEQAFGAFVLKRQHAEAAGVPPFRARQHFVSVTFEDWTACTRGGLDLPGVGAVAVNKRRALPVRSTPVTVKHRGPIWQACFSIKA
jgi:helix-turn-helix protein